MDSLVNEVKTMIIECLNLTDLRLDEIDENAPLFSDDGLGLDSVDALELGLNLQKRYGITLDAKKDNIKEIFYSVASLADYIKTHKEA